MGFEVIIVKFLLGYNISVRNAIYALRLASGITTAASDWGEMSPGLFRSIRPVAPEHAVEFLQNNEELKDSLKIEEVYSESVEYCQPHFEHTPQGTFLMSNRGDRYGKIANVFDMAMAMTMVESGGYHDAIKGTHENMFTWPLFDHVTPYLLTPCEDIDQLVIQQKQAILNGD